MGCKCDVRSEQIIWTKMNLCNKASDVYASYVNVIFIQTRQRGNCV